MSCVFCFYSYCFLFKTERGANKHPVDTNCPTLLIAQAEFHSVVGSDGKAKQQPGPAILTLKQKISDGWQDIIIEDSQSNVFHKATILPEEDTRLGDTNYWCHGRGTQKVG